MRPHAPGSGLLIAVLLRLLLAGVAPGAEEAPIDVGDKLDAPVPWQPAHDLSPLAGKPVRLRFVMSDCDLYAFRFGE